MAPFIMISWENDLLMSPLFLLFFKTVILLSKFVGLANKNSVWRPKGQMGSAGKNTVASHGLDLSI